MPSNSRAFNRFIFSGDRSTHRPPQLVSLSGSEPGDVDRHLHQLLLEKRYAQCPFERFLQAGVVVGDRFELVAAPNVGVDRPALDGSRANQRHLDNEVVEIARLQTREGRHLRPRFHLEHPDGVRPLQHLVHGGLAEVEVCEIDVKVFVFGDEIDHVVQSREHPQAEQVELHQTRRRTVILVPLQNTSVGHPGPLDRADIGNRSIADDHSTGVNSEVTRKAFDLRGQLENRYGNLGICFLPDSGPARNLLTPRILLTGRKSQRFRGIANGRFPAVGDHIRDLSGVVATVFVVDELDRFLTTIGLDIDVDIRRSITLRREKSLEQQLVAHRVDIGDADGVADCRIGCRPSPLTQDVVVFAERDNVVDDEEIAGKSELADDPQFVVDLRISGGIRLAAAISTCGADQCDFAQPRVFRVTLRSVERWQRRRDQT